jgi:magnesium chelatase family protein
LDDLGTGPFRFPASPPFFAGVALLAQVLCSAVIGIEAYLVEVEVDIAAGLPAFTTVGLPEAAVKESRERVKAAIHNSGYRFPDDRITVNLAPAHIKKDGTGFDLPIAVGILAATQSLNRAELARHLILGELSLDGRVKPVAGSLPMALAARQAHYDAIIVPQANSHEAAVVQGINVYPAQTLAQVIEHIAGGPALEPVCTDTASLFGGQGSAGPDFRDVVGQEHAKRALEVAAGGGHNVLMIGPPGSGKTMLARRLPSILPALSFEEAIETTKIYSVVGRLDANQALVVDRPFRAPHHTISDAGLIGGGHIPRPGEVSLAHNGILFLDEMPEFKKHVLEVLRQPLEDRQVTIARAASTLTYPAAFMLVSAMNPCPCGYLGDPRHACRCTIPQIQRYRAKVSGPMMDRIDIHVEVPAVAFRDLTHAAPGEPSERIRQRVSVARQIQQARFARARIHSNAQMNSRQIKTHCRVDRDSVALLESAIEKLGLSARAYNRILKIARTIADLAGEPQIAPPHIAEAIQYRNLDRA